MVDLGQSGIRNPVTLSIILTFSSNQKHRFILQKLKAELKNFSSSYTIAMSKGNIFAKKMDFYLKVYFLKLHICTCLRTKFQIWSIILTSFRQDEGDYLQETAFV